MEAENPEFLEADLQQELLILARNAIDNYLRKRNSLRYSSSAQQLSQNCGAFVSLHKKGALRGCIGYITSERPLYETVIDAAVSAATGDPRFAPVTQDELPELEIEISVLTPPQLVENPEEIEVGRDGLIITMGHQRGLLLPQVASEYGWDTHTFLDHTCMKAGLAPGAWRKGATIERFSAHVFSDSDIRQ